MKKYKLVDISEYDKYILSNSGLFSYSLISKNIKRIVYLKDSGPVKNGQVGGFINSEDCLLQDDDAYILEDAVVIDSKIRTQAIVSGTGFIVGSWISGNAFITGNSFISHSIVSNIAAVSGSTRILNSYITGNAYVTGDCTMRFSCISGNAIVKDRVRLSVDAEEGIGSIVTGNTILQGNVTTEDSCYITGKTIIGDNIYICNNVVIKSVIAQGVAKINNGLYLHNCTIMTDDNVVGYDLTYLNPTSFLFGIDIKRRIFNIAKAIANEQHYNYDVMHAIDNIQDRIFNVTCCGRLCASCDKAVECQHSKRKKPIMPFFNLSANDSICYLNHKLIFKKLRNKNIRPEINVDLFKDINDVTFVAINVSQGASTGEENRCNSQYLFPLEYVPYFLLNKDKDDTIQSTYMFKTILDNGGLFHLIHGFSFLLSRLCDNKIISDKDKKIIKKIEHQLRLFTAYTCNRASVNTCTILATEPTYASTHTITYVEPGELEEKNEA